MTTEQPNEPTPTESEVENDSVNKGELYQIMAGDKEPPERNRRLLAGVIAGALVGTVEAGMPHNATEYHRTLAYIIVRILTGMACAWVPWRTHAMLRGIVFGLIFGIPFYLTYSRDDLLRGLFLAAVAGFLIGSWTERYGVSRNR